MDQKFLQKPSRMGKKATYITQTTPEKNLFSQTFLCISRAPVITSSPSEDHTYSAGGGAGGGSSSATGSGASTPLINGSSSLILNGNGQNSSQQGCADNQSNCASSDAAYESSEERYKNIFKM